MDKWLKKQCSFHHRANPFKSTLKSLFISNNNCVDNTIDELNVCLIENEHQQVVVSVIKRRDQASNKKTSTINNNVNEANKKIRQEKLLRNLSLMEKLRTRREQRQEAKRKPRFSAAIRSYGSMIEANRRPNPCWL